MAEMTGRPTVQLRHRLPDGSEHVDWLIAQDPRGALPLLSFRVARRIDDLREGEAVGAERLAEHRPMYLSYEGPISGDRGEVERLCGGTVVLQRRRPGSWELQIQWRPGASQRLRLDEDRDGRWSIRAMPPMRVMAPGTGPQ